MTDHKDSGPTARARRLIDRHIVAYGYFPYADRLKEEIATELGFVQLASIPHRDDMARLQASVELLREAHELANSALRSAWQIAERDGRQTNWEGFRAQLRASLEASHAAINALGNTPPQVPPVKLPR